MSQQAAAGRGAPMGRGGGRGTRRLKFHPRAGESTKGYKSTISEIAMDTFNTGQNKFAVQFTQSRKNVVNYLQRTSANEGYLVAETVRTGRQQIIELPPAINPNDSDADDQRIIRAEEVKTLPREGLNYQSPSRRDMRRCTTSVRKR
jgi:hypothetical protein